MVICFLYVYLSDRVYTILPWIRLSSAMNIYVLKSHAQNMTNA